MGISSASDCTENKGRVTLPSCTLLRCEPETTRLAKSPTYGNSWVLVFRRNVCLNWAFGRFLEQWWSLAPETKSRFSGVNSNMWSTFREESCTEHATSSDGAKIFQARGFRWWPYSHVLGLELLQIKLKSLWFYASTWLLVFNAGVIFYTWKSSSWGLCQSIPSSYLPSLWSSWS